MKGLIFSILLAFGFGASVLVQANRPIGGEASLLFVVPQGDGPAKIAERLKDAGLIRSSSVFKLTVWSRGHRGTFKAGAFELSPSMSTREIETALASHDPVSNERDIRVLEGWTLNDIADYLEEEGLASKNEFFAEAGESAKTVKDGQLPAWSGSFSALADKPFTSTLEGYLFPDTYRVYVDSDAKAIVRRMLANFESKLSPELRSEIKKRGKTIFEIVTMASVIEREVRGEEDRARVSDIFWRRVAAGRGLEADSTVNYITGGSKPAVSYEETRIDHPWNTYKYRGLPPGPIGNPGLSAIRAAIFPKKNEAWYFLTDKEGNVHYGVTLDDHNANKRKYLK